MLANKKSDSFYLIFIVLLGLAIRLDFAWPNNFVIDADEGIVGLMAKHISEGAQIPTFYYGQNYMGSLEPMLAGLLFKLFGISNISLKAVPLIFSLALIILIYKIAYLLAGKYCARIAALLTAVPPVSLLVWSSKARGGFIELVVIGGLAFYYAIQELQNCKLTLSGIFKIFLMLGFGWWVNNQIIFFILPICLSYLISILNTKQTLGAKLRLCWSLGISALFSFLLGGLPFWIYNLQNNFISFEMFTSAKQSNVLDHFWGLIDYSIPILIGSKHFWEADDIFPNSTLIYSLFYCFILLSFCGFYRKDIFKNPLILLSSFILCTFSIFVVSSFGHLFQAPRYLLPTYISIFLISALVINKFHSLSPLLAKTITLVILSLNLLSAYAGGRALPGEPIIYNYDRVAKDHTQLIKWLDENNITAVRTNYWIGYRLAFETKEKVKFLVFQHPTQTRIKSYREEILANFDENKIPLILSPSQLPIIESALSSLGYSFSKTEIDGYKIIYNIIEKHLNLKSIPNTDFDISATNKNENISLAVDHDIKTRWGSGEPQNPKMQITITFHKPHAIRGINIDYTNFETDFPRGLIIEAELEDGSRKTILNEIEYKNICFYIREAPPFHLNFDPVNTRRLILKQTGSDSFFDWSIAELSFEE